MALGPDGKPYKTRADVHMARESLAHAFAKRREALILTKGASKGDIQPSLLAELAPNIPVTSLEKTNKLAWILTYLAHRFGPRDKLPSYEGTGQSGIHTMADMGNVALYGDWASGTLAAAQVATRIREHKAQHTIHMGDVYFVGDEDEARENFLGEEVPGSPWQAVAFPRGTQRSFALNGNHEMYARGKGYFRRILPALDQQASFFALQNQHWRIIGLDSGYHSWVISTTEMPVRDIAANTRAAMPTIPFMPGPETLNIAMLFRLVMPFTGFSSTSPSPPIRVPGA